MIKVPEPYFLRLKLIPSCGKLACLSLSVTSTTAKSNKGSTQVGSGLAFTYLTKIEVTDSYKHFS
jgi:hypothetical protein